MTAAYAVQVGDEIRVTGDLAWNDNRAQYTGQTGHVVEVFPYDHGVAVKADVIPGRAPLPLTADEYEVLR